MQIKLSLRHQTFSGNRNEPPVQNISSRLEQYIYGSVILAITAAIMTGLLTLAFLKLTKVFRQYKLTAGLKKAV